MRRLAPAEVVARLEGALFGVRAGRSTSDVFVLPEDPPSPDREAIAARCRALADRVPGLECRLGTDANERPVEPVDIISVTIVVKPLGNPTPSGSGSASPSGSPASASPESTEPSASPTTT